MTAGRSCQYTHDVSGQAFDDLDGDEWRCPHPPTGNEYCSFHARNEDESLDRALLESIENETPARNRFLGASFESLSLDYRNVRTATNHPIDLRDATVAGDVSCTDASISPSLFLQGATVQGAVRLERSTFDGRVLLSGATIAELQCEEATFHRRFDMADAEIDGDVDCRLIRCDSWADMREVEIHGDAHFRSARFQKGIYGVGCTFGRSVDFVNATFDKVGNFKRSTFEEGANFAYVDFEKSADFTGCTFDGPIGFQASKTTGEVADHRAGFDGVGWFDNMSVGLDARFSDARITGDLRLRDVVVDGALEMDVDAATPNDRLTVDLRGSAVAGGTVSCSASRSVLIDLTDATVGDVHFTGSDPFGSIRVNNTTFEGFDFSRRTHRTSLAASDWRIHDPSRDDHSPAELENTYLKAKNGAAAAGASKVASEFFRKELISRRRHHLELSRTADSVRERIRYRGRYTANLLLGTTTGYGERPSYVFVWALGIVFAFAGLYSTTTPSRFGLEHLLFSFQSFITFILGTPPTENLAARILSSIQGFLGAFFIALFVFTLTRSIHR